MSFYGINFEPYVGPFDGTQPVLYNTYTLDQVKDLLGPVYKKFNRIRTYGQGTFVWESKPRIQDSNKYNIEAANAVGLTVSAGCYQQGANSQEDRINVKWTKTEIDYAIAQAKKHGNVDSLIVGNECLWGPSSTADVVDLITYAKEKRTKEGFTKANLPISTCQEWGVLAGVNNLKPDYKFMRGALLNLVGVCEGFIYGNMYSYFDPNIGAKIKPSTPESVFKALVTASMVKTMSAFRDAFSDQKIGLELRIGETGWPTKGTQAAQPLPIATVPYAEWHCEAMSEYLAHIKTFLFAGYDEPWKGNIAGSNSEAYFGVWKADGTSTAPGNYTLRGETEKYLV